MKTCLGCGEDVVDPDGPARYDVLSAEPDAVAATFGPYCEECFPATATGQSMTES